jgi:ACS family hexuronate transporter-like MFS transporter
LLFFATTINYLDRSVLSILAPFLQREIGWTEIDYGHIVAAFQLAYGAGVVFAGKLLDKYGSRIVFALGMAVWSVAGMGHALAQSVAGFFIARFFLGLGESANFPASIKTVAEWFPQKQRALITGIFNAGSTIGAILSPLLVPLIAVQWGWRWAFIITGMLGLIWLLFWLKSYRLPGQHKKVTAEELAYINADPEAPLQKTSLVRLIFRKETLIISFARFFTDPVWWFLLYWLPKFLEKQFHISLTAIGMPLITIYVAADLGGIGGGWLSSFLIKKGKSVNASRKIAMLACAVCALPMVLIAQGPGLWTCVLLISLASAAHQGWASNIFTLVSDIFPRNEVATVVGISTVAAVLGGILAATAIGWALEKTNSYSLVFSVAGCMYLLAWLLIKTGIPVIKKTTHIIKHTV